MNFKGSVEQVHLLDLLKSIINIRYKRTGNNDPRRVPPGVSGKDHANDYRECRGIDDMLDVHVLNRLERNTIKG